MKKKEEEIFKNPFIKEYLFNIQVNQKISISEFLFTKKVFVLTAIALFLIWYNNDSANAQKYIAIGSFMIFLYLFKNNRILKKEKYFINDGKSGKNQEMFIHIFTNKVVKNILKKNYLFVLLIVCSSDVSYADFMGSIENSIETQTKNNEIYSEENETIVERSKVKMINYLVQEKKIFHIKEIIEQTKIESDLEINNSKINLEKVKNDFK